MTDLPEFDAAELSEFDAAEWLQKQLKQAQRRVEELEHEVNSWKFQLKMSESYLKDVQAKADAIRLIIARTTG